MSDALAKRVEPSQQPERLATGFGFTEGPLWHPDGYYYFVDIRTNTLFRLTPGKSPETVRENTGEGNGTTFDLQGRLVMCEGSHRRVTRRDANGPIETLMWGSDYPHGDGVWPESSKYIEEQFGHLPAEMTRKITCENAGRFYGLIK